MKAIELLKNKENLLIIDENTGKKVRPLIENFQQCILDMNDQIASFEEFANSQLNGEISKQIILAQSLAEHFANNKHLKLETVVDSFLMQEKNKLNEYYTVKTKMLDILRNIIKESTKEAVVCAYDLFEGDFKKCEPGHEIIILNGRNVNVIETFIYELEEGLVVSGNFDKNGPQPLNFNYDTINKNIETSRRKNNEIYGAKQNKFDKAQIVIEKLEEVGRRVVEFYTYKEKMLEIGTSQKGIKDYENELSKAYIPLKKAIQKEFRIELDDICNVSVNEESYPTTPMFEETTQFNNTPEFNEATISDNAINTFEGTSVINAEENTFETPVFNSTENAFEKTVENNLETNNFSNEVEESTEDISDLFQANPTETLASPFGTSNVATENTNEVINDAPVSNFEKAHTYESPVEDIQPEQNASPLNNFVHSSESNIFEQNKENQGLSNNSFTSPFSNSIFTRESNQNNPFNTSSTDNNE